MEFLIPTDSCKFSQLMSTPNSPEPMDRKKRCAVVTGGNKGIGLETCRQLALNDGIEVICSNGLIKMQMARSQKTKSERYLFKDYWRRCWVIMLWIGVMVGLFTWKWIQYKDRADRLTEMPKKQQTAPEHHERQSMEKLTKMPIKQH
ncbi:hypothetical protein LXL04_023498 [Taraxacum kok-saghyz]